MSVGALHDFGLKGTACGKPRAFQDSTPQAFFVELPECLFKLLRNSYVQHCFVYLFLVPRADSQLVSVLSADVTGACI